MPQINLTYAQVVRCLLLTLHNTSPSELTEDEVGEPTIGDFLESDRRGVYGDSRITYVREKCAMLRTDPMRFLGSMDNQRLEKFVAWAIDRYGAEVAAP